MDLLARALTHIATGHRLVRLFRVAVPLLVILALLVPPPGAVVADQPPRVHSLLLDRANARPDDEQRVIVQRVAGDRAADRFVEGLGGRKVNEVKDVGFVAKVKGKHVEAIGRNRAVKWVSIDAEMRRTDVVDGSLLSALAGQVPYPGVVGAAEQWAKGVTGKGVGVAVVDSGVNVSRGNFKDSAGQTRVVASLLFNSELQNSHDGMGHGTHVAGIVAGNSWNSSRNQGRGKYIGIAPEANIINLRVSDELGMSYLSDVVNAINWAVDNRQTYTIRVMNLSLVSSVAESATTSVLDAAVERAWLSGIFVVVAAGNYGPNTLLYPPANDPFVVTVGAADTMGTLNQADDTIAWWSSYGTTQDGYTKPDVAAPGRWIIAPMASKTATLVQAAPNRVVDGSYLWASGTSMAAPVVSGIAALAYSMNQMLSNDELKWLILNTAVPLVGSGSGAGEANATAMFSYTGPVGLANQGLPISPHLTTAGGATTYSPTSSWSTSSWSTSSWSTSSWSTSSWSTSSWSTSSWSTSSWSTSSWSTSSWSTSSWSTSGSQSATAAAAPWQDLGTAPNGEDATAPPPNAPMDETCC
ncbi:MAG: S8 family peptidase [Chloroflexi bacterium]|nr:S8 family peptidase [Chloroflexota bacterium]